MSIKYIHSFIHTLVLFKVEYMLFTKEQIGEMYGKCLELQHKGSFYEC